MTYQGDVLYLFYGYGCEYSLAPLAKYMKDKSYDVLELDLLYVSNAYDILSKIKGRKIVFLTSWHLFFDKNNFNDFYKGNRSIDVLSPLEIMDYVKPIKSIYYPHDLTIFLHEQEWSWLDLFDAAMVPYKNNDYYLMKRYTQVYDVGWIKKTSSTKKIECISDKLRIVHFPSNLAYLMSFSPAQYYEQWKPLFDAGVKVKFPLWSGFDEYINILEDNDVGIIDSSKTVFDVINECDIITTTGGSSVLYEAGLSGCPVISVLDGAMTPEEYNEILPSFTWLYKFNVKAAAALIYEVKSGEKVLYSGNDVLKPFDFDLAEKITINLKEEKI